MGGERLLDTVDVGWEGVGASCDDSRWKFVEIDLETDVFAVITKHGAGNCCRVCGWM